MKLPVNARRSLLDEIGFISNLIFCFFDFFCLPQPTEFSLFFVSTLFICHHKRPQRASSPLDKKNRANMN